MTDVLGETMTVSAVPEASSRGAALLVLESMGAVQALDDVPIPLGHRHEPDPARREIYARAMARQQRLYRLFVEGTATEHVAKARQRGESL
jgi:gluconokinase